MSIDQTSVSLPPDLRLISTTKHSAGVPSISKTRDRLYTKSWDATYQKISAVVLELQRDLLDDLVTFVRTTVHHPPSLIGKPIPTALLVGSSRILNEAVGIKIGELTVTSESSQCIPESIPVQLASRACLTFGSTIKTIVASLESSLKRLSAIAALEIQTRALRTQPCLSRDDVDCIRSLYAAICALTGSKPKIVFIVEDFEAFNSAVFEELVLVLSGLLGTIPVMMVLSLTTSVDALHSLLHRTLIVRLQVTPFAVHMGDQGINLLIQNLIFNPEMEFDLSPGVIRSLFLAHEQLNNSIDNVISKLQFIHLSYFHTNPLVAFFDAAQSRILEAEEYSDLIDGDLSFIGRQLSLTSSWQTKLQNIQHDLSLGKSTSLTMSETDPSSVIDPSPESMLSALVTSYRERSSRILASARAFELLRTLAAHWPEKERTTEWLLYHLYQAQLRDYSAELCRLLRHSNDDSVSKLIPSLLAHLEGSNEETEPYLSLLNLLSSLADVVNHGIRGEARAHLVNTHEPHMGITSLVEADRSFSRLLGEISESLSSFFKSSFGSTARVIMREAWTFDDERLLKEVFHPSYGESLIKDLENHPDLEIGRLYELYKESGGRRINLADWIGAFGDGPTNPSGKSKGKGKGKGVQKRRKTEARFLRGVGGLGFMGFVGIEKRKAEHVARMVW
ncbi:uncharacterized protein MELLADRAFT_117765 [Melampsora larici-populina 98AG31]|uniref:Uncharacterized protein n=1 Tax=Melampsora larici-populina (strain 98AG31 / pathotype 3-4-7) TaxID=747676 RepID=F4S1B2_MELLP|nr:uncharacterized protein MELLADRAFT_117765 [Melampsora larici-populina 98AG31]EGG01590.1 hypothetical protein MELLADRAFT_117765 [Melampsora larici-populina 98AG31]